LNVISSVVLGRTRWLAKFPKPWTSQKALTNGASSGGGGDRHRDQRPAVSSKRNSVTCRIVRAHAARLFVRPSRGASIDWPQERLKFRQAPWSYADTEWNSPLLAIFLSRSATQKPGPPRLMPSARQTAHEEQICGGRSEQNARFCDRLSMFCYRACVVAIDLFCAS
jgi:hypothetical protein